MTLPTQNRLHKQVREHYTAYIFLDIKNQNAIFWARFTSFTESPPIGACGVIEITNLRWYIYIPWVGLMDNKKEISTLYSFFPKSSMLLPCLLHSQSLGNLGFLCRDAKSPYLASSCTYYRGCLCGSSWTDLKEGFVRAFGMDQFIPIMYLLFFINKEAHVLFPIYLVIL